MSMLPVSAAIQDVTFPAADGIPLKGWHWPQPEPKGWLVISHGLGEHGAAYSHVAEAIGPALGLAVLAFDYRGHGRSPGRRGAVRSFEELVADLRGALAWAAPQRPDSPRFLLGHSKGGLVALRALLDDPQGIAGLIVSNPALRLAQRVPWYKRGAGAVLRRLAPGLTLPTDVDPTAMTRDLELLAAREHDPLRHARISAGVYYGILAQGGRVLREAGSIRVPTLLILGGADPLIDPAASAEFFARLGSPDKTLRVYPAMLHEPLNELGREQVIADILAWLSARRPQG